MDDQQRAREPAPSCLQATLQDMRNRRWINDIIESLILRAVAVDTAALRAAPEGFVMVPVEMDLEMEVAFCEAWFSKRRCIDDAEMQDAWAAALAARPQGVKDV